MYWDDHVPILPYTKSAFERKKGLASAGPHLGSAANLEIHPEESDFVPMETIMEEETQIYSSPTASPGISQRGDGNVAFDNVTVTNSTATVVPNVESDSQKGLWMGSRLINMLIGQSNQSLNTTSRVSDSTRSLFRGSKANINAPFILKTPRKRLRTTSMRTNSSMQVSHPGGDHLHGSISDDLPTAPVILPSAEQPRTRLGSRVSELRAQPGPDGFRFPSSYTGSPSLALLRRNSPLNSSLGSQSRKSSGAESESVLSNQANTDAVSNVTIDSTTSARTPQTQVVIQAPNESLDVNELPQELLYEPEPEDEVPETAAEAQSNRSSDESLTFTESNQSTVRSISELISKSGPKES